MAIRSGGRPKLKTENLMVRLNPRLKAAVELAARIQGCSQSRIIESAIEKLIEDPIGPLVIPDRSSDEQVNVLTAIWDRDEAQRFINLAEKFGRLLFPDEEIIWTEINSRQHDFFHEDGKDADGYPHYTYIDADKVRAGWAELQKLARQQLEIREQAPNA